MAYGSNPKPPPTPQDLTGGRMDPPAPMSEVQKSFVEKYGGGPDKPGPDETSADYKSMCATWDKVRAISGGTDAMRAAGKKYLPKFDMEDDADYNDRKSTSPFLNKYEDVVSSLCAKPFTREVQYEDPEKVAEAYHELYEDVDGQGNNLHVFAEATFRDGVDNAVDWILVEYTKLPPLPEGRRRRTQAEEKALNARPYWVHVAAPSVLAAYTAMSAGKEVLTHFRVLEPTLVRAGYAEKTVTRVRQWDRFPVSGNEQDGTATFGPAQWVLLEKEVGVDGKVRWFDVDSGEVPIGIIPAVPFVVGKRRGNGWQVRPPLANLLDMQIDAFQQESNLRNAELMAAYPMLTANGVAPPSSVPSAPGAPASPDVKVRTGPRAVLWAPPSPMGGSPGSWNFIEPTATSLTYLKGRLDAHYEHMADIGMAPLSEAPQTVITSANVSVKANSALQAWALRLKDTLEQAMVVTALWLEDDEENAPGVDVYTDFGVDVQGEAELNVLESAAKDKLLSGETFRGEMKRRNVLSANFDEKEEQERLATEAANANPDPGDGVEGDVDPVTGDPLNDNGGAETGEGGDPADPSKFSDASEIDDDTLAALFGEDAVRAAK
jgi:hypothetical protein